MIALALFLMMGQGPGSVGNEVYRDAEAGLSIRLAGGFRILKRQESLTILGSNETPGVVMIESGESFSSTELAEAAQSGYKAEGVSLQPEGAAVRLSLARGEGLAFPVKGVLDGETVRGVLSGVRTLSGRCFLILAATTPAAWPKLEPAARRMIEGISLDALEVSAADPSMHAYFAGTRLSFYTSRTSTSSTGSREGGFSGVERIYLCSNGSFYYGEQSQGSFDVPQAMGSARSSDTGSGRWQASATADGAALTISFHDGRRWNYRATRLGKEVLYLNGSKYFRSGQTRCK
ncbi:MAG: hypothetical protein MUC42_00030 [Bryobacter sp.]|nr:hypothetical protein [Bryobacter sp.]